MKVVLREIPSVVRKVVWKVVLSVAVKDNAMVVNLVACLVDLMVVALVVW